MATTQTALQAERDARIRAQQLAWQNAQQGFTTAEEDIAKTADKLAQETWTQKRVQEKALPNVMQQAGLSTTGYTETTANNINTNYQNAWNQVMGNKQQGLKDVGLARSQAFNNHEINMANIEGDYQAQLAQYLASLRSSGTGDGGGNTKVTESILTGMNSVQFDPYKGLGVDTNGNPMAGIAPLFNYLKKYVDSGAISEETAITWLNNHISKYTNGQRYPFRFSRATTTTNTDTKTSPTSPTSPTNTSAPAGSMTLAEQWIKRGSTPTVGTTKTSQIMAF